MLGRVPGMVRFSCFLLGWVSGWVPGIFLGGFSLQLLPAWGEAISKLLTFRHLFSVSWSRERGAVRIVMQRCLLLFCPPALLPQTGVWGLASFEGFLIAPRVFDHPSPEASQWVNQPGGFSHLALHWMINAT